VFSYYRMCSVQVSADVQLVRIEGGSHCRFGLRNWAPQASPCVASFPCKPCAFPANPAHSGFGRETWPAFPAFPERERERETDRERERERKKERERERERLYFTLLHSFEFSPFSVHNDTHTVTHTQEEQDKWMQAVHAHILPFLRRVLHF